MRLQRFLVKDFRNIKGFEFNPHSQLNVFVGENAQGKTNLLEAIFAALKGKSFRPYVASKDWKNPESQGLFLSAQVSKEHYSLTTRINEKESGSLSFFINEKKVTQKELSSHFPIVVFSPDDHALIRGAPELRRNYLDDLFCDADFSYADLLERYEKIIKARNKILRDLSSNEEAFGDNQRSHRAELYAWTELLAKHAMEVRHRRGVLWAKFSPLLEETIARLLHFSLSQLSIEYLCDLSLHKYPSEDEKMLKRAYLEDLEVDVATGWTHRGPHRDDFAIRINEQEAKTTVSQGQARLLAFSLRWAHKMWLLSESADKPLFLIDDFSSELDSLRRSEVLKLLLDSKAQMFLSSTQFEGHTKGAFSSLSGYAEFEVNRGFFRRNVPNLSVDSILST